MSNANRPPERWADRVRFLFGAPSTVEEIGGLETPLPDRYQVIDLEKTAAESTAIAEALAGINDFRQAVCGLPPVSFSADRVHILEETEFREKLIRQTRRSGIRGKNHYGHVYLCREKELFLTVGVLVHELLHATAYFWFDCHDQAARLAFRPPTPSLLIRRCGLALIDPSYLTLLPHFHGLNEMATETAAVIVRQLVAKRTGLLSPDDRERLSRFCASPPQIHLLDRLIGLVVDTGLDRMAVSRCLFRDMFLGTDTFLERLETAQPGATEVLRATGARPEELLAAASKLGLDEAAEMIGQYCPDSP